MKGKPVMKIVRTTLSLLAALSLAPVALAQTESKPADSKPADTAPAAEPHAKPDDAKKAEQPAVEKLIYVKMSTSMGDIVIELNSEKAPISTQNFLRYVESGYYSGTVFHRVIDGFMVQGGGFTKDMSQKSTNEPIKNEWKNGLKNARGTIAMARTNIADSATSQFFINVVDNKMLDEARDGAAYAVFGKVVEGMDVVDKIKGVKTTTKGPHANVPVEPVEITGVTRLSAADAEKFAPKNTKPAGS
jgi:cyclophilin family peptidyl-prolyl cis-trans isomerase